MSSEVFQQPEQESSSPINVEVVEVNLINQAVLDTMEVAASYHPPPTYQKADSPVQSAALDRLPGPHDERPLLNLCGRPRCTWPLEGKTPTVWITTARSAHTDSQSTYWIFGLVNEPIYPPARSRNLPTLPLPPHASPIMEVRTMQDDRKPTPHNKWIHNDKAPCTIVLAILQLHTKPSVDGFGERGMTVLDLDDVFEILGEEGGDHMTFSPLKQRSVLRDDSPLLEKGREMGLPRLVMAWLGGAQLGARLILPSSTMKAAHDRAVELFLARKRLQQGALFASEEDRSMVKAAGADNEPAARITLWKGTNTFPGWLWSILLDTHAKLDFCEPETEGIWASGATGQPGWEGAWL
ncbi:hypothetical protein DM02DRAFT_672029 [Periconia macrospinosa]|uniref:Uncharacterized protein n=1 Tax=Periconia macrospinosa TaxID=97972 RepID=A0A2V1DQ79_9PLEO|nr:hypothetical protein DM02DRAFT_672029 [Periconia macrospinosa]